MRYPKSFAYLDLFKLEGELWASVIIGTENKRGKYVQAREEHTWKVEVKNGRV